MSPVTPLFNNTGNPESGRHWVKKKHFTSHSTTHRDSSLSTTAQSEGLPVTVGAIAAAGCRPRGFKPTTLAQQGIRRAVYLTNSGPASSALPHTCYMLVTDSGPYNSAVPFLTAPHQLNTHHKALLSPPIVSPTVAAAPPVLSGPLKPYVTENHLLVKALNLLESVYLVARTLLVWGLTGLKSKKIRHPHRSSFTRSNEIF